MTTTREQRAREALRDNCVVDDESAIRALLAFADAELESVAVLCDEEEKSAAMVVGGDGGAYGFTARGLARTIRNMKGE